MKDRARFRGWRAGQRAVACLIALNPHPSVDVVTILRDLRRRMVIRQFLDVLARAALCAAAVVLVWACSARFFTKRPPVDGHTLLIAAAAVLCVAAISTLLRKRTLASVAERVDALGQTKDRLVTAFALQHGEGQFHSLARRECASYLQTRDLRPLVPLHPPRTVAWLVVPLIALVLLQVDFQKQTAALGAEAAKAQEAIASTVREVEQLAQQTRAASEQADDQELKRLAEELQRSAERLKTETNAEQAQKSALRELSSLEQMMRELQRQPSRADEVKELAKALSALPGMQEVMNALNEGDVAAAQQAMDRALKEQAENKPEQLAEEEVEKRLRQAMEGLAERRRLSDALQKLAEQMRQKSGAGASQSAMQQLAKMLQQMRSQGKQGGGDGGQQQQQMTLQELITALENMKFGEGDGDPTNGSKDQSPGAEQAVTMQSFGSGNRPGPPQAGEAEFATGQPGTERDFGTTETPFGPGNDPQEKGGELALKGQLSEGESLSMMLPSAGDTSKSARRYKELYEAMAGAAENSVEQENIPLGSRFLIKRYFESIRPRE